MCVLCSLDVVQVGLDPIDYTVIENTDSAAVVCARLDRPLQRNGVRVQFSTRDGSALSKSLVQYTITETDTRTHYLIFGIFSVHQVGVTTLC